MSIQQARYDREDAILNNEMFVMSFFVRRKSADPSLCVFFSYHNELSTRFEFPSTKKQSRASATE